MAHLTPEALIDLAEDTVDPSEREPVAAHLASCAACREQLAEARTLLAAVADAEVPEPSPLFWNHLSSRVREAVAAEAVSPTPSRWLTWLSWPGPVPSRMEVMGAAAACAIVVLAVMVMLPGRSGTTGGSDDGSTSRTAAATAVTVTDGDAGAEAAADEASLDLLATLADGMSWEDASEAGLTAAPGAVDNAIMTLTAEERLELQRLLQEELARAGQGAALGAARDGVQG